MKSLRLVYITSIAFLTYLFAVQDLSFVIPVVVWVFLFTFSMMYDIHIQILRDRSNLLKKYE